MNTTKCGVYCIVHIASGKRYVGSTSLSFSARWSIHKSRLSSGSHHNRHLQAAWRKYGEAAFEFRICEVTQPEHAVACEQVMIDFYKSTDPRLGYNIALLAHSMRGTKRSKETLALIAKASKEVQNRPEVKAVKSAKSRAFHCVPEERLRQAERIKAGMTDKVRARISQRAKQIMNTPKRKAEVSAWSKARMSQPEVKAVFAALWEKKYADPQNRKAHGEAVKAGRLRSKLRHASALLVVLERAS